MLDIITRRREILGAAGVFDVDKYEKLERTIGHPTFDRELMLMTIAQGQQQNAANPNNWRNQTRGGRRQYYGNRITCIPSHDV